MSDVGHQPGDDMQRGINKQDGGGKARRRSTKARKKLPVRAKKMRRTRVRSSAGRSPRKSSR